MWDRTLIAAALLALIGLLGANQGATADPPPKPKVLMVTIGTAGTGVEPNTDASIAERREQYQDEGWDVQEPHFESLTALLCKP